jgi:hypothetical protein
MKRALLGLSSILLLLAAGSAPDARLLAAQEPRPQTTGPKPPDPLEEFVPHEKLEADSVVAFPVDI